jgi:hypothetical protein
MSEGKIQLLYGALIGASLLVLPWLDRALGPNFDYFVLISDGVCLIGFAWMCLSPPTVRPIASAVGPLLALSIGQAHMLSSTHNALLFTLGIAAILTGAMAVLTAVVRHARLGAAQ